MNRLIKQAQIIRPRNLLFIFLGLAGLMISSAVIELRQSKRELLDLLGQQAHTLLESVLSASRNTLTTNILIEELIEERLLNNATMIKNVYEKATLNNQFLGEFARQNNLYRINIFNREGDKIFSSHPEIHPDSASGIEAQDMLAPIFEGEKDTLLLGLRASRYGRGSRYAVAMATTGRGAVVVNMDADQLLEFRREVGIGSLLQSVSDNPGILYTAIQDSSGILAASGNIIDLERIVDSPFLNSILSDSVMKARMTDFKDGEVFEAVHPFRFEGETIGLIRLGISLEPLEAINKRIYRRIIIISILLLVVGFFLFAFILLQQNLDFTRKQYQAVETYSQNIIQNVSDAIIVISQDRQIKIINRSAETLFGIKASDIVGKHIENITVEENWDQLLRDEAAMRELKVTIRGRMRYILLSRSQYRDEKGELTYVLVWRDLTDQKRLENQVQRRERLSALGQLASGVAHEIRNPLNAIGTVVQ
ncbi:MAG: PAS domain S-box protein, partial [Calditrichaeota bacterium]